MKTAVLCHSQTGFTERYAQWIASRIDGECFPLSKSRTMDLSTFDVLIFGTWMQAGNLHALADFVKIRKNNPDQPVFLFVTGAASSPFPDTLLALDEAGKALNTAPERVFYFPGGLNYSKMSLASRLMLKMLAQHAQKEEGQIRAGRGHVQIVESVL
ncbi:MAG: flavodoxin domain-containing protein [Allobaculum sp.]|uniref:flavodoxin domain-containing protein n=1 Tax=Allobaculum sp. TaxID=1872463 RepID=UPI00399BC429